MPILVCWVQRARACGSRSHPDGRLGICGGMSVVPLNALLQERGHETIGAGNALAVQNFAENIAMLSFVGAYSWAAAAGIPIARIVVGFGLVLLAIIGGLAVFRLRGGR